MGSAVRGTNRRANFLSDDILRDLFFYYFKNIKTFL